MEGLALALSESLQLVQEARADVEYEVVDADVEDESDADSINDDVGLQNEDPLLNAFLNGQDNQQPGHICEGSDSSSSSSSSSSPFDSEVSRASSPDPQPGQVVGPSPVDTRLRQRTTVHGKRLRKDANVKFKLAVRCEWDRLKGTAVQVMTAKMKKTLFAQLRDFAHAKDPNYILHHSDQVETWPQEAPRGSGSRKRAARRRDHRRLDYLDALLVGFIKGRRDANSIVTRSEILQQANKFLEDADTRRRCHDKETVKLGYIQKMLKRGNFKVKAVKKRTDLTNDDVKDRGQKLGTMIYRCIRLVDAVLNFDEVPGSLAGVMGKLKTVAEKSDVDVRAYVSATAFKRCCTLSAIGCVVRDTDDDEHPWKRLKLKPIILLKGEPTSAAVLGEVYDPRVIVAWTKKGVITGDCMQRVVIPSIRDQLTAAGVERCLTILDCASSHLTPPVVNACWASKLPTAVVSAGGTSWLQWVDTHFAAAYRVYHRDAFLPYAAVKMTASQKRRLLARIVADAHEFAGRNVVQNFATLGYTNPEAGQIRGIVGYKFVKPQDVDLAADEAQMKKRIDDALAAQAQPPAGVPVKRPPAKLGRPPQKDKPVTGCVDIRKWFVKAPAAASSAPPPPASSQR